MQKLRRILALLGVVILIGMYVVTLIFALSSSPNANNMLMASIVCTVVVPCLLYGIMLLTRVLDRRDRSDNEKQDKYIPVIQDKGRNIRSRAQTQVVT